MPRKRALLTLLLLIVLPGTAGAVLDVNDRGPVLNRGNFNLRVTNAGILGNAFLDAGLSNDPSFESPPGSGYELLNFASLWVGGTVDGQQGPRVSGAPLLEFRPTLDTADHVWLGEFGRLGSRRFYDDDNDGREDEETLNNRDDDGDFEIDEDLGMFSQQMASADYVDDRPEAVNFVYEGGETHVPLGLSVHQEVFAWSVPGFDRAPGVSWRITNHGDQTIRGLYVGMLMDGDSKLRTDLSGHLNDRVGFTSYSRSWLAGKDSITIFGVYTCGAPPPCPTVPCYVTLAQGFPVIMDGVPGNTLPMVAPVGLWHTTDPLAQLFGNSSPLARAPASVSFRYSAYANARIPGQGGLPVNDEGRFQALQGSFPQANLSTAEDYVLLVSCGPFPKLEPGNSIEVHMAMVAGVSLDSIAIQAGNLAVLEYGVKFNRIPETFGRYRYDWNEGRTGINGHEICLEPPPGVTFDVDPHCPQKFGNELAPGPAPVPQHFEHGRCIWTDADCEGCTGNDGMDAVFRWNDPGMLPPAPKFRLTAMDHNVRLEWDNLPEILLNARLSANADTKFLGYRIWKLQDWRERPSLVPPRPRWALVAGFGLDTLLGALPLVDYTDDSIDFERILYEQKLYPPGRYRYDDPEVLNGFDYMYVVSTVYEIGIRDLDQTLHLRTEDTPIAAEFVQRVVPHAAARDDAKSVWVVPNPFKANADWDRPRTYGDALTRHLDFMGLPRERCTIKIWTIAGDFVAQIDHDGRNGDGQAPWDLVSRNGQDVSSGIYIFTVDSPLGRKTGRFVIVR